MNESPVFSRTYDLLLWLIPQAHKFPRSYRFNLGERIQRLALDFQESLVAAGKSRDQERHAWLRQADLQLEELRVDMRLARDLHLITFRQYEHVIRMANEVGRLLGAWIKQSAQGRKP